MNDTENSLKNSSGGKPKRGGIYIDIFESVWNFPIISAALLCFFSMAFISGGQVSKLGLIITSLAIFALGCCAAFYEIYHKVNKNRNLILVLSLILCALYASFFGSAVYSSAGPAVSILNIGLATVTGIYIYLGVTDRLTTRNIILLIAASAFLIRFAYILYFSISAHQHDVSYIGSGEGHIGYIEYFYKNGHLPDFDVREVNQFYHPPLHHIISAVWVKIQTLMGIKYENAFENIQILTLFYSTLCLILSYRIFRLLNLNGKGLIFAFAIIAFNPTFIIMSGSINNDILSITFILGAVVNTLKWYRNRSYKNIIGIALCIGLGMFTKLSVWMVAPAVAFVFIYVFFKNIHSFKKYLAQFAVFGIICVPLGLFWSIRNLVMFNVPITYVMKLSETSKQYIGDIDIFKRMFDFNVSQFENVGDQFTMYGGKYNEYNPLVALFKTSAFDEGINTKNYYNIAGFNTILFWFVVIVGIIGFAAMIYMFVKKTDELETVTKIFIGILYSTIFISYYIFCFEFPHVCTENIRYAVPLIVIGAYFVGLAVQRLSGKEVGRIKRAVGNVICTAVIIYSASSALVYDLVVT